MAGTVMKIRCAEITGREILTVMKGPLSGLRTIERVESCLNADRSTDAVRFEGHKWETIDLSACEAPDNVKRRKLLPGSSIIERVDAEIETDPWRPLAKNLAALAVKNCLNADRSVDAVRFEGYKWETIDLSACEAPDNVKKVRKLKMN